MKLESSLSQEVKARFKLVRTDDYTDVPGEIVAADESSGDATLFIKGKSEDMSFGSGGFRIVSRRR